VGVALHEFISSTLFGPRTVAAALVAGALAIFIVEARRPAARTSDPRAVDTGQALLIGMSQCVSLWPGFSRSAATILGGMLAGLDRRTATEFSFLLAIPTMLGATVFELYRHHDWLEAGDGSALVLACAISFLVAWASLRWLLRYVASHDLRPFAWYRLALGAVVLFLLRNR
jgi:undecaprenyl-diphosphatase